MSNLYFTTARVLGTLLAGLSTATNAVITASDSVLSALGKLQKQISDNLTTLNNLTTTVGTKATDTAVVHIANTETVTGAKTFSSTVVVNAPVKATILTLLLGAIDRMSWNQYDV